MNESRLDGRFIKKDRSKKNRLQKKLEDFEYKINRFGGDESDFLLESQWNTNLDRPLLLTFYWNIPISKACYLLCVRKSLTFFRSRVFLIGQKYNNRQASLIRSFLMYFTIRTTLRKFFRKVVPHSVQLCTHLRISGISRNALRDAAHMGRISKLVPEC